MAHHFGHILLTKANHRVHQNQEEGKQTLSNLGKATKYFGHGKQFLFTGVFYTICS